MNHEQILRPQELADATFDLLASSTIDRYARMAKAAAARSVLKRNLREHGTNKAYTELIGDARAYLRRLVCSEQREVDEMYLAVLVALLASTGAPGVDALLIEIGLRTERSARFISALARQVRCERAQSVKATTAAPALNLVPTVVRQAASPVGFSAQAGRAA